MLREVKRGVEIARSLIIISLHNSETKVWMCLYEEIIDTIDYRSLG